MQDDLAPWEQMPEESGKAYAAFCAYRDMGRQRSLTKAYRQHSGHTTATAVSGSYASWSITYEWLRRAEAYDAYLERLARQEREEAYVQDLEGFRARQKQLAAAATSVASLLLLLVGEKLKNMKEKKEIIPATLLPSYARAAAAVAAAATNSEAQALAVEELLKLLNDGIDPLN
jgi:hypothetical protein